MADDQGIVEIAEQLEDHLIRGGARPNDARLVEALDAGDELLRQLASTGSAARSIRRVWNLDVDELRRVALAAVVGETFRAAARELAVLDRGHPFN